jgi:environmental stress-induced protein Ves
VSELTVGLLARDDQALTPWRSGGGVTRELATGVLGGQLAWRVSIAHIDESGAFSTWPGMHRSFTVLTGDQVVLTVAGNEHAVLRGQTFEFSGDADVTCSIPGGPVEALNVMTRRGAGRLAEHGHDLREGTVEVGPDDLAVLVEGEATVRLVADPAGRPLAMHTLDALLPVERGARVVEGVGELIVVRRS